MPLCRRLRIEEITAAVGSVAFSPSACTIISVIGLHTRLTRDIIFLDQIAREVRVAGMACCEKSWKSVTEMASGM